MFENIIKKSAFLIAIIFLFYLSYLAKNFQLLLITFCFIIIYVLFFTKLNKNLFLIFFSILFSITIIEITLFFINDKKIVLTENQKNLTIHVQNDKTYLGYQPKTGKQHHKIVINDKTIIDNYYTINKNNYRLTPKINDLVKEKTFNFFGGSQTFGWGLNDHETLPYLTQPYFKKWNINNFAISGYGVHQMLTQIKKEPRLIGDINILVTYKPHVPRASCKRNFTFGTPKYILNDKEEIIRSGYCNFGFLNSLPLPSIVGSIINRSEIKILLDKIYFRKSLYNKKDIKLYLAIIKEINKILSIQQKVFYIGYISEQTDVDNYIVDNLKENNVKIIDLSLDKNDEKYKIPIDGHPTKEANLERSMMIWNDLKNTFYE